MNCTAVAATPIWEIIAVLLAYAYVWLAANANRWCWPCGFASTAITPYCFGK